MGNRWVLVAGDVIVFLIFAAWGRSAHDMQLTTSGFLSTVWPFLAAWFIVGIPMGVYRPEAYASAGAGAKKALFTWIIGEPVALALRSLAMGRLPHWSFALVSFTTSVVLLVAWRALYGALHAARSR